MRLGGFCRRMGLALPIAILLLAACSAPKPPAGKAALVLVPVVDGHSGSEAEQRGLLTLLASRLRAMPGLELHTDALGCARVGAEFELRLLRRLSNSSDIMALELKTCASGLQRQETFISPREARRDWSPAAAWWVASQLGLGLAPARGSGAVREQAMLDYLGAIGHLQLRTGPDIAAALKLLQSVVELEPEFAAGHAELAVAELLASEYGLQPESVALQRAEGAIVRALEIDAQQGLAHAARGLAQMVRGRYRDALTPLLDAHRLEPGHDSILLWLGNAHLYSGEPRQALPWLQAALDINPALIAAQISTGEAHCYAGMTDECQQFLAQAPQSPMHDYVLTLLHGHRGEFRRVLERLRLQPPAVDSGWVQGLLQDSCRALGRAECARSIDRLESSVDLRLEADLWRLDLRLGPSLRLARSDPRTAERLRAEIARLRAAGVSLDVLGAIEACLDQRTPPAAGRAQAEQWARLLDCPP